MKKAILLITIISISSILWSQPNNSYTLLEKKDDVNIYYKWKKRFPFNKTAQRNLIFYIDNQKNNKVLVSFSVDIFSKAILHSSTGNVSYCLPSNYEISGKFKNLAFDTGLTWEAMNSDSITWEINQFKVKPYEGDCKSNSNWLTIE